MNKKKEQMNVEIKTEIYKYKDKTYYGLIDLAEGIRAEALKEVDEKVKELKAWLLTHPFTTQEGIDTIDKIFGDKLI